MGSESENELLADKGDDTKSVWSPLTPEQEQAIIDGTADDMEMLDDPITQNKSNAKALEINSSYGAATVVTGCSNGVIVDKDLLPLVAHSFKNCFSPQQTLPSVSTKPATPTRDPEGYKSPYFRLKGKSPTVSLCSHSLSLYIVDQRKAPKRKMSESDLNSTAVMPRVIIKAKDYPKEPLTPETLDAVKSIANELAQAREEYEDKKQIPTDKRCTFFGSRVSYARLMINCGSQLSASYMLSALNSGMGIVKCQIKQEVIATDDKEEYTVFTFRIFFPDATITWEKATDFIKRRVPDIAIATLSLQAQQVQTNRAGAQIGMAFSVVANEQLATACGKQGNREIRLSYGTSSIPVNIRHVGGGSAKGKLFLNRIKTEFNFLSPKMKTQPWLRNFVTPLQLPLEVKTSKNGSTRRSECNFSLQLHDIIRDCTLIYELKNVLSAPHPFLNIHKLAFIFKT